LQRATPDAQASVRVQASVAINEPVVTVLVRVGCTAPFSRRYVLLADPISEPAVTSVTAIAGGVPTAAPRALNAGQLPAMPALGVSTQPNPSARCEW
jgi:Tfp pilus assembly protein FimV